MSNIQRLLRPSEAITASLRVQDVNLAVRALLVVTNLDNAYEEGRYKRQSIFERYQLMLIVSLVFWS